MSLIKKLIQRLLDSRTTPEEAGHSAMPSTSYITPTATAVQAWGQMAQGVAPFDGFVRASARASNTSSNIRVTNDTATVFAQSEGTATGQTQGVFVPVAKGDSWTVYGTNRDNVVVRLVKAIGGGYNFLVRRALSCLRALSNYLQRGFCKINIQTSLINVDRALQLKINQLPEGDNKISLPPLAVGQCFRLAEPMKLATIGSDWKTPQERLATSLTLPVVGSGLLFRYRRAMKLLWILVSTRAQGVLPSFATNRLNSLRTGGALC